MGGERWDEARHEIELALANVEATGEARHLAEIHRARATCARGLGQLHEAAAVLRQALAVARRQQAGLFEQRALADLAAMPKKRSSGSGVRR